MSDNNPAVNLLHDLTRRLESATTTDHRSFVREAADSHGFSVREAGDAWQLEDAAGDVVRVDFDEQGRVANMETTATA